MSQTCAGLVFVAVQFYMCHVSQIGCMADALVFVVHWLPVVMVFI
jgi:hypothetical protein